MNHDDLANISHTELADLRAQLQAANAKLDAAHAENERLAVEADRWMRDWETATDAAKAAINLVVEKEQANAALKAEVERLTKECVAYRNGSGGFISSPSLHTTTSDVPESFKRGMEEIENGEVTPMFRQSAIDELNDVAEALSGEPEIARLKAERDAARALNDTLAGALKLIPDQRLGADMQEAKDAALDAYAKSKEAQP